jgi:hypothetical protein
MKQARVLVAAPIAPSAYYKKGLRNEQIVTIHHTYTAENGDRIAVVFDPERPELIYNILVEFLELIGDAQDLAQDSRSLWQRFKSLLSKIFRKK